MAASNRSISPDYGLLKLERKTQKCHVRSWPLKFSSFHRCALYSNSTANSKFQFSSAGINCHFSLVSFLFFFFPNKFSFPLFPSRDEVLQARSLQRLRFEMARSKKEPAREACDLLLLSLYCNIPPGWGLEVRTLEVVPEAELTEPFVPPTSKTETWL